MSNLTREIVDANYPRGPAWDPVPDGVWDRLRSAKAENLDKILETIKQIGNFRNPQKTIALDDLEREFGIDVDPNSTETERRALLTANMFAIKSNGSIAALRAALDASGFNDVFVYENDPVVNPNIAITAQPILSAGALDGYAGNREAYAGYTASNGYIFANGIISQLEPIILSVAGQTFAGGQNSTARYFEETAEQTEKLYISNDSETWAYYLLVGGSISKLPNGNISAIETITLSKEKRTLLEGILLKFKPIQSWLVMAIKYT